MICPKIRLHVSPLSPDLLSAILPSNTTHLAENISYHTLQTFPENNYGYLELPSMEAEKVKKKLNGSILKGKRIRIEEARPLKRSLEETEAGANSERTEASPESSRRPKRTKHDPATISGHELSPDRKVKRGWTEPKRAKVRESARRTSDQTSSKYTDKQEILFRTKVPLNKIKATKEQSKKDKRHSRDVLVHEFEKSTIQPSFLREEGVSENKRSVEYVEGKGWIDEDGKVVEEESTRLSKRKRPPHAKAESHKPPSRAESTFLDGQADTDEETSSAGSSSDSESSVTAFAARLDASRTTSVEESEAQDTPTPLIHPLEAIFKRPSKAASVDIAKPSLEVQTSFSFFEPDQQDSKLVPDTPLNSQELRSRELRSAAPTPDTAAPSRFNSWGSRDRNDVESEDDDEEEVMHQASSAMPLKTARLGKKGRGESDFAKFFWENRGDNNRAWKRRAREAKKEKRQRENRQRSRNF